MDLEQEKKLQVIILTQFNTSAGMYSYLRVVLHIVNKARSVEGGGFVFILVAS